MLHILFIHTETYTAHMHTTSLIHIQTYTVHTAHTHESAHIYTTHTYIHTPHIYIHTHTHTHTFLQFSRFSIDEPSQPQ